MTYLAKSMILRVSMFVVIALAATANISIAALLQPTTTLPPPAGVYNLPAVCITPVCLVNVTVGGFQMTSDEFSGGNELVSTTAVLSASVFQNNGGSLGAALGSFAVTGVMDFTFFDRSPFSLFGTFDAQLTAFNFMGTFNNRPFTARQNALMASLGETAIFPVAPGGPYQVDSFFDVFAELSIDNGPFIPGPVRNAQLSGVPEPSSAILICLGLAGLLGMGRCHRR